MHRIVTHERQADLPRAHQTIKSREDNRTIYGALFKRVKLQPHTILVFRWVRHIKAKDKLRGVDGGRQRSATVEQDLCRSANMGLPDFQIGRMMGRKDTSPGPSLV